MRDFSCDLSRDLLGVVPSRPALVYDTIRYMRTVTCGMYILDTDAVYEDYEIFQQGIAHDDYSVVTIRPSQLDLKEDDLDGRFPEPLHEELRQTGAN